MDPAGSPQRWTAAVAITVKRCSQIRKGDVIDIPGGGGIQVDRINVLEARPPFGRDSDWYSFFDASGRLIGEGNARGKVAVLVAQLRAE